MAATDAVVNVVFTTALKGDVAAVMLCHVAEGEPRSYILPLPIKMAFLQANFNTS